MRFEQELEAASDTACLPRFAIDLDVRGTDRL